MFRWLWRPAHQAVPFLFCRPARVRFRLPQPSAARAARLSWVFWLVISLLYSSYFVLVVNLILLIQFLGFLLGVIEFGADEAKRHHQLVFSGFGLLESPGRDF